MNANQTGAHGEVKLARRNTFQVDGPAGTMLRVTHGEVWVTRHLDTEDYILGAGDVVRHDGKGKMVVTATKDACIEVEHCSRAEPALRRLQRTLRMAVGRAAI